MSISNERRQQERFASILGVSIDTIGQDGNDFTEVTLLRDISGSGLSFLTKKPHHYDFGQSVEITLFSSKHSSGNRYNIGNGKVMWIDDPASDSSGWIGIMLDDLMSVEHLKEKINDLIAHVS